MARCEVQVALDPANTYRALEPLRGIVRVDAQEPTPSKAVIVELRWRVRGRGNPGSQVIDTRTLHNGPIEGAHEFPFEFPLPNGPVSVAGQLMTIEWSAEARVNIEWAVDPKASTTFDLLPTSHPGEPYNHGSNVPQLGADSDQTRELKFGPVGWIMAGFGMAALVFGIQAMRSRDWGALMVSGVGFGIMTTGMILGWRIPRRLAERRMGKVRVDVEPLTPQPGQEVRIRLRATPRPGTRIGEVHAILSGEERVARGTGKNRRTTEHVLHKSTTCLLPLGSALVPGSESLWETTIRIPSDALPSFWETDNQITWTLALRMDLPASVDWTDTVTLGVIPGPDGIPCAAAFRTRPQDAAVFREATAAGSMSFQSPAGF
jgi:hypothetical protein